MAENGVPGFDPAKHLIQLRGRGGATDYLPVAARVSWFRDEAPDGQILTEAVRLDETIAVFRAEVRRIVDGEVRGTATGYGSETPKDFADYIEKAESKAIGRALGALGYGTAAIAYEADQGERVVDAPVERRAPPADPKPIAKPLTEPTNKRLHAAANDKGIDHTSVRLCGWAMYGAETTKQLTDAEGRELGAWFERLAPVEAEFLARLIKAPDQTALEKAWEAMKSGGVGNDLTKAVYARRWRAFNAAS